MKKSWYCAHTIFYFKDIEKEQEWYLIHENVYLIQSTDDNVWADAENVAREHEDLDKYLTVDGQWLIYIYAGIRKIVSIAASAKHECPAHLIYFPNEMHGAEITYSVLAAATLDEITKLIDNEPVLITYRQ